jgi:two-component system chemotaxis response regulator CheY
MKKILVVEDDTSIRELLVEILEGQGYLVTSSVNGSDGIKSLETIIPDLILMDVMMPVMDGYAFKKELLLNPKWNLIPVVVMSAQSQGKEKLADYGITNFISKPLELNHLLETLRNIA